jgi:hypothetical protein
VTGRGGNGRWAIEKGESERRRKFKTGKGIKMMNTCCILSRLLTLNGHS